MDLLAPFPIEHWEPFPAPHTPLGSRSGQCSVCGTRVTDSSMSAVWGLTYTLAREIYYRLETGDDEPASKADGKAARTAWRIAYLRAGWVVPGTPPCAHVPVVGRPPPLPWPPVSYRYRRWPKGIPINDVPRRRRRQEACDAAPPTTPA